MANWLPFLEVWLVVRHGQSKSVVDKKQRHCVSFRLVYNVQRPFLFFLVVPPSLQPYSIQELLLAGSFECFFPLGLTRWWLLVAQSLLYHDRYTSELSEPTGCPMIVKSIGFAQSVIRGGWFSVSASSKSFLPCFMVSDLIRTIIIITAQSVQYKMIAQFGRFNPRISKE